VNETWSLKKPEGRDLERLGQRSRVITIEKSRCGRGGTQLLMQQEDDLSFSIRDFTPEVDASDATPASHSDRVLQRLRTVFPRTLSRQDLNADPLVGGKVAATKKALQRLVKRGLIEVADQMDVPTGSPLYLYRAVLSTTSSSCARGEIQSVSPREENASAGTKVDGDTPCTQDKDVPDLTVKALGRGHIAEGDTPCLQADPSGKAENGPRGHSGEYPRARAELDKLDDEAASFWKE
jgi:hypothetical protein